MTGKDIRHRDSEDRKGDIVIGLKELLLFEEPKVEQATKARLHTNPVSPREGGKWTHWSNVIQHAEDFYESRRSLGLKGYEESTGFQIS